jgi:hypothetical protein
MSGASRSDLSAVRVLLSGQRADGKVHRPLFFFALTMAEKAINLAHR